MLTYSIAIRTLGTGGEAYRRLLESICRQTAAPERVLVYIAEGHAVPDFRIGREEYVVVPKGMLAQRALPYDEIDSDCILMLDDDVELDAGTAARMMAAMEDNDADCVAADTFANHRMPLKAKLMAAVCSQALPSCRRDIAFRIRRSGAFSYINRPVDGKAYPSESAAGPAAMWRKDSFLSLNLKDEEWVERGHFAYGEDQVTYYKLCTNGGRLFVLFGAGAIHLDGGNSSRVFRKNMPRRMYVRTKNTFIIWWRTIYEPAPSAVSAICFAGRTVINSAVALLTLRPSLITAFFSGLRDGLRFVRSDAYRDIPPYRLK